MLLTYLLPVIINLTDYPIEKIDLVARKGAERTCKQMYKGCLDKFYKTDVRSYRAICKSKKQSEFSFKL